MTRVTTLLLLVALPGLAVGQCPLLLQTPPGLPAGNGQNGAMFDVIASGGAVVIQDFSQSFFTAGGSAVMEVWAVTAGTTFVGNETTMANWTLLGTSAPITASGPGIADPLGLTLNFLIPAGAQQGFYVTSNNAATIAYTNGTGAPLVTSGTLIDVTEGVGKSYPFAATFTPRNWNGEICYAPAAGLFANFSGTPLSGSAPLTVSFTDLSTTDDLNGIQTWGWDFGDGNNSTMPNPTHTYTCPGTYDVSLMVTDTLNPAASLVRTAYVTVGKPALTLVTTGVGDLTITPADTGCYSSATSGYTLISLSGVPGSAGGGPLFGITPDLATFLLIGLPALPDNLPHFLVTPTTYPNAGPVAYPPGFFSGLGGVTLDAVEVLLNVAGTPVYWSDVAQVTF